MIPTVGDAPRKPVEEGYPQSVGLGNGKTYNQHAAVQHRNVMLVANHPLAQQTGHMRVFFPKSLRKRLVERDGWVVLNEAGAWLGVKVLSKERNSTAKNYELKKDEQDADWLWPNEENPPVAFVVSDESRHRTFDDFLAYLASHQHGLVNGRTTYAFVDDIGAEVRLELGGDLSVPNINGKPVDLQPAKVFDSPFMSSVHGSGIVDVRKGDRHMHLDFNKAVITD